LSKKDQVNLFWDSCVFCRYLEGDKNAECFADIEQHLDDVKSGKTRIFYSDITILEVRKSFLSNAGYGDFDAFVSDFEGEFQSVQIGPDILRACAEIRDFGYPNPNGGKDRQLTAGDAIQLVSASWLKEQFIPDLIFHTFDDGKGRNIESDKLPAVSLLNFERFCQGIPRNSYTDDICALERTKPFHQSVSMFAGK
jgi:hypothetical protein